MNVTVRITISREEADEYRKGWKEFNDGDISDEFIKDEFLDMFWADKQDYLDPADIECEIV